MIDATPLILAFIGILVALGVSRLWRKSWLDIAQTKTREDSEPPSTPQSYIKQKRY